MKPLLFHPEASNEYKEAVRFYGGVQAELGGVFFDEIERLIQSVRRQPELFVEFDPPVKRALARKFPYSVIYLNQPSHIWVVTIMHAKRSPGYWRERLG